MAEKKDSIFGGASIDGVPYEVHDAYHTLRHAHKIVKNKRLMHRVKEHAGNLATEHKQFGHALNHLARTGKISMNQMKKLKGPKKIARPRGGVGRGMAGA